MAGVDLPTVKELLGHKDMTLRSAHLSTDHQQAAVKKLEQVPAIFTISPDARLHTARHVIENSRMGR
jgi:hypothetical protein